MIRESRRADRIILSTNGRPGTGARGALWEAFLEQSLPDPDVQIYVQKLLGYGLQAGNPKRLFSLFIGPTSTGKTTIGEIVRHTLGQYAGPFNLSLFRGKLYEGPRTDVVKALAHRVIFASEASQR